jgi:transcriptional regulator with XRE-family HTH domain
MINIGKIVRDERERQGLSVRELERKSNVSYQTIYHWEHSTHGATIDSAHLVLKALGVEVVIGGKGDG